MLGELDSEKIERLLREQILGRIGCYSDGEVYVIPVTYAYDGIYIYAHSNEGMKIEKMRKNPKVCFQVDSMENMGNWQSVIAWGQYEELSGEDAMSAMQFFSNRLKAVMTSITAHPSYGLSQIHQHSKMHSITYRLRLVNKTGRFETM